MGWLTIGLLETVAALHIAGVSCAVLDREHVSRLVRGQFTRPLEAASERFGVACGISKAGQRPDPDSFSKRCKAKHKIPAIAGP